MHSAIRTLFCWCLLSLSAFVGLAHAQQDDLYSVRVAVEDQSAAARYGALQEGLRQVLVKITGNSRLDRDVLPRANRELEDLVSEYLYQPALEPEFHDTGVDLVARFMPGAVDRIVRTAGLPVWPASRPRVLVWLVADSADGPRYLSAAQIPEIERALLGTFAERAVVSRQPLLDLEDQFALPPEEAWSLQPELLQEASQRYSAPVVLLLRLEPPPHALEQLAHPDFDTADLATEGAGGIPLGGEDADEAPWWIEESEEDTDSEAAEVESLSSGIWSGEWLLLSEEQNYREATAPGELAAVIAASVHNAIDALAHSQAYLPTEDGGELAVGMEVRDLLTFDDFRRAEALINGMEMVENVRLVALTGGRAQFELVVKGGGEIFLQSLRNSGHFNRVGGDARFEGEEQLGGKERLGGEMRPVTPTEPVWGDSATVPPGVAGEDVGYDPVESAPSAPRSFQFSWVP